MTFNFKKLFTAGIAGGLVFSGALLSRGATATVTISNFIFTPATTNINTGDQVVWNWTQGFHSTTSGTNGVASGLWDSTATGAPHFFTNTFNSPGNFAYYCSVHFSSFNMKGNIIVASPNLPPSVTITNPANATVLAAPANVTIRASATDSDGTVTNVQFFVGTNLLTNITAAPFAATTNNLAAGNYTLSAIATDNSGANATNSVSISVVTPVALTISSPKLSGTNFQFSYAANSGLSYIVQLSTNLLSTNWLVLGTNVANGSSVNFTNKNATNNPAFYRVGRLPNP